MQAAAGHAYKSVEIHTNLTRPLQLRVLIMHLSTLRKVIEIYADDVAKGYLSKNPNRAEPALTFSLQSAQTFPAVLANARSRETSFSC